MRVAHIITRLIIGGAQENTLFNVDDQHHIHGDDVCLITGPALGPEGSLIDRANDRSLDVRIIPELRRSVNPWRDWRSYRAIRRQLSEYQPDVVHTHSSKAGIIGRRAAYSLGIPCVHTIHGAAFHFGQPTVLYKAYQAAERMADKWCDHFISVCDAMSQQYLDAGIGNPAKFTTIYSGMDVDRFRTPGEAPESVRKRLGIRPEDIVVGKIARLFPLKGHQYVLDAARAIVDRVPNVKFLFVGDGILRADFEHQIQSLGLTDHFVFAGLVPPDEVVNYIHAMDLVVHTSVWEGLARVLPQALIAGRPIVSFDIDGAPEVCIDGKTGMLIPSENTSTLGNALVQLCSDAQLRETLGKQGQRRFSEQFCHRHMTERIREVYKMVCKLPS